MIAAASAASVIRKRDQERAQQARPVAPQRLRDQPRPGQDIGRDLRRCRTTASHSATNSRPTTTRRGERMRRDEPFMRSPAVKMRGHRAADLGIRRRQCAAPRRADTARSTVISASTRPGRVVITTMRLDRNTDSNTLWVTKTTVQRWRRHSAQQILVELEAGDLVERGEGLVEQQQPRLGDQRARDRDAHAHAARKLARIGTARSPASPTAASIAAMRARAAPRATPASRSGR